MKLKLEHKDDESGDHLVPLSRQAVEVIDVVRSITGKGPFVFPNTRHAHKPMSENAMGYLLNRAGYHSKHAPHGFRSSFSTIMNERFPASFLSDAASTISLPVAIPSPSSLSGYAHHEVFG